MFCLSTNHSKKNGSFPHSCPSSHTTVSITIFAVLQFWTLSLAVCNYCPHATHWAQPTSLHSHSAGFMLGHKLRQSSYQVFVTIRNSVKLNSGQNWSHHTSALGPSLVETIKTDKRFLKNNVPSTMERITQLTETDKFWTSCTVHYAKRYSTKNRF
jgi:hypothetical protein